MTDTIEIPALPAVSAPALTDLFPVTQSGVTKHESLLQAQSVILPMTTKGDLVVYSSKSSAPARLPVGANNTVLMALSGALPGVAWASDLNLTSLIVTGGIRGFRPIVQVSGTTKTFDLTDANTFQYCSNGSAVSLTVPPSASVAFTFGDEIEVFWGGDGQVSFIEGSGVAIQSEDNFLKIAKKYTGAILKYLDTDVWALIGRLAA